MCICVFSGFGKGFQGCFQGSSLVEYLDVFFHCWSSCQLQVKKGHRSALSDSKTVTSFRMSHEISYSTCIPHCCLTSFTHAVVTLLSTLSPLFPKVGPHLILHLIIWCLGYHLRCVEQCT